MTKEKKSHAHSETPTTVVAPVVPAVQTAPTVPAADPVLDFNQTVNKLSDMDKAVLDLAKERKKTALAEAKEALAKNENAELAFKYVVLQLYMKYGMSESDALSENGDIIKGGAAQSAQNQAR